MSETSLYERLGREENIRLIAGSILDNHLGNDKIKSRFRHVDRDETWRKVTEFICAGTGGPQHYTGRGMLAAHRGMNISEMEFIAVVDDIKAALESNGVGEREKQELLAIAHSLKGDIVSSSPDSGAQSSSRKPTLSTT
ncbi:MAG: group 1 truncated hemoglobin [Chromatiaceae bacterium]|mgnify:FL=1|nr:group 1 truncated hemoglobin [Gammaproteobacteria bacterium]MCP5316893.1 group 1 truncated hemoglobin [Chromatiaceae bacterium]MCW5587240.1 group 1 truncated hemoglobin [Chromatiales bacterium]MCP5434425.1 group 1 truncated hemoglobin [Chromatiaceae bacterium]HOP15218.1 group 1 truncated hemoglobin [Gammaproteobacteria bacterium]